MNGLLLRTRKEKISIQEWGHGLHNARGCGFQYTFGIWRQNRGVLLCWQEAFDSPRLQL